MPPVPVFGSKSRKYKSIIIHRENYEELAVIAKIEGRYITGQFRIILDTWKRQNLSKNDLAFLSAELAALRAERDKREEAEIASERRLRELEESGIIPRRVKLPPRPGRQKKRELSEADEILSKFTPPKDVEPSNG